MRKKMKRHNNSYFQLCLVSVRFFRFKNYVINKNLFLKINMVQRLASSFCKKNKAPFFLQNAFAIFR
jgi:hypothetical protein